MKRTILVAALLTVLSAVSFASVTELGASTKFQVVKNQDNKYDLYYVSENNDNVLVRILNDEGKVVNYDKLDDIRAFKRTYNFKDLPAGNYTLEVRNKDGKAKQPIFHNPLKNQYLHTIVGQLPQQNKFKVYVSPSESEEPIEVKIYDERGKMLLKETIKNANGFSKIYDLTSLTGDHVTFHISKGQETNSYSRDLNK